MRSLLLTLGLGLAGSASAQLRDRASFPFPMDVLGTPAIAGTLEMRPDSSALSLIAGESSLRLLDVPLADGQLVNLDLERVSVHHDRMGIFVDGQPSTFDPGDQSLWKGIITDRPETDVFLTLASYGCYGWVHDGLSHHHLMPFVEEGSDWSQASARWVPEEVLLAAGPMEHPVACLAEELDRGPGSYRSSANPSQLVTNHALGTTLECKMAVETDYQFHQVWGNLTAAQNYMTSLLGAMSDRYETTIDVVITYPYVMFYTDPNDPWTAQGGGAGAMLTEFRQAWAGNIPGGANLAHFMSGASLGGGVAYLDVLCNQNFGFAVSGNLNGGVTFPVSQGSNTWDFMVTAHETGHNFGTSHTHNYCPTPLDECADTNAFGQCQTQRQCINNGTVMSYCHTCSGGMNNITTFFHPQVATVMRTKADNSCLPPYTGGGCTDDGMEPNDSCGAGAPLAAGFTGGLKACDSNADYFDIQVAAGETLTVDCLFSHSGGNLNLELTSGFCLTVLGSSNSTSDDEQIIWTNNSAAAESVSLQVYLSGGSGNNGYSLEVDLEVIDPCPGPDDSMEPNDSCVEAAPLGNEFANAWIELGDPDFYSFCVNAGSTLDVDLFFSHASADIDMRLSSVAGCGGTALVESNSGSNDESLSWTNSTGVAQTYVLEVFVFANSAGLCSDYFLVNTGAGGNCSTLGVNYCDPSVANSTGLPGIMTGLGSTDISQNDFTVVAGNLPVNQTGYFLAALQSGFIAGPGGSQGVLCVGSPAARFVQQAAPANAQGEISAQLDLTSFPLNPAQAVMAGELWHFQCWYRDFNPNPTSNFTDGLAVAFQ
ncbi:MAG: hypothetical protein ACI8QC_002252 [Planctomycetota bacterium]|jgi:hypothetical protein